MAVMIVSFNIEEDDSVLSRAIHGKLVDELRRGRTENQIHLEDGLCFISTPENIYALSNRLVGAKILRIDKDGLAVIDERSKKIFVWGICDMRLFYKYPRFEMINIYEDL